MINMNKDIHNEDEDSATFNTPLLEDSAGLLDDTDTFVAAHCQYHVLALILSIVFVTNLATSLSKAPLMRVFESIICQNHYERADASFIGQNGNVDEQHCKISAVQQELALLRGWQDFFDYLPGLFLAIPFGMLADRYGRKWLNLLNVACLWLQMGWIYFVCAFPKGFPIRLIWAQSILGIFGGGPLVASALSMVIMTDVTPESKRANVFFCAHAVLCATEFLGPPLGSVLMNRNPWIAFALAICLLTLAIPLAVALPETFSNAEGSNGAHLGRCQHRSSSGQQLEVRLTSRIVDHLPLLSFLLRDNRIGLVLIVSISFIFGQACANLMLQYISHRYDWTLSEAAYLSSVKAAIMFVTLLGLLPFASDCILRRRSFTPLKKDTLLLRISLTFVTIGFLIEGLAPSTSFFIVGCCIATMGMGATAVLRSLLASLVKKDEVGRLFAVMSSVWTAAMLIASPAAAFFLREGLKSGGMWTGLPFIITGLTFGVATAAIWMISLASPTVAKQETRLAEELELEREKGSHVHPISWTSPMLSSRTSVQFDRRSTTAMIRPLDLATEPDRLFSDGMLMSPACSPIQLLSPGLRVTSPLGNQ